MILSFHWTLIGLTLLESKRCTAIMAIGHCLVLEKGRSCQRCIIPVRDFPSWSNCQGLSQGWNLGGLATRAEMALTSTSLKLMAFGCLVRSGTFGCWLEIWQVITLRRCTFHEHYCRGGLGPLGSKLTVGRKQSGVSLFIMELPFLFEW